MGRVRLIVGVIVFLLIFYYAPPVFADEHVQKIDGCFTSEKALVESVIEHDDYYQAGLTQDGKTLFVSKRPGLWLQVDFRRVRCKRGFAVEVIDPANQLMTIFNRAPKPLKFLTTRPTPPKS